MEANVATGYHAIEFLLWGQDLNGHGPGARLYRPFADYVQGEGCTGGNCDRRAAISRPRPSFWSAIWTGWRRNGPTAVPPRGGDTERDAGIVTILTGMGSLSYGEQAGERMRLGLMLNDPEEEHDCFSDNTHNSHFYDGLGIQNVYLGSYTRVDGSKVEGPALADLVAEADAALDTEMQGKLSATMAALGALKAAADGGFAYDQMLERGNAEGEALIMGGVNGLIDQTKTIERVVGALGLEGIEFEGSDSLDNPSAVFQ
ncbi:MAG: imelysin family protein [Paracoccaceae bacterium]